MEYIGEDFIPVCKECEASNSIIRRREVEEFQTLDIDGTYVSIADSDFHVFGDWVYECYSCGEMSSDIEDLLAEKDEDV